MTFYGKRIASFPAAGGCRSPELAPLLAQLVIYITTAKIAFLQLNIHTYQPLLFGALAILCPPISVSPDYSV